MACASVAWMATRPIVSATAAELRATSSMLAEVAVAAVVCSKVAAASCSATADSLLADSVTSPRRRNSTPLSRSTMALKVTPRWRTSPPPLTPTRTVRSPASARAAARESATIGRMVNLVRMIANAIISSAPAVSAASVEAMITQPRLAIGL